MSKLAAKLIGEQLRRAREERGLSVIEASRVLRVKRQMVYKYEKGDCLPALDVLSRAARAWNKEFELEGCKVLPQEEYRGRKKPAQPVQQFLPFRRARHYKGASVKIRPRDHEMIITAVIRNTA